MPIINMVDTVLTVAAGIEDLELAQTRQHHRVTKYRGEVVRLQSIFDLLDAINRLPPRFTVQKAGLGQQNPYNSIIHCTIELVESDTGFRANIEVNPNALEMPFIRKIISNIVNDRLKHIKSEEE
jgi:hypothetical protein